MPESPYKSNLVVRIHYPQKSLQAFLAVLALPHSIRGSAMAAHDGPPAGRPGEIGSMHAGPSIDRNGAWLADLFFSKLPVGAMDTDRKSKLNKVLHRMHILGAPKACLKKKALAWVARLPGPSQKLSGLSST